MFFIYSVESGNRKMRLSQRTLVCLLVMIAVWTNVQSWQQVREIQRQAKFQTQIRDSLDELMRATDAVAAKRQ